MVYTSRIGILPAEPISEAGIVFVDRELREEKDPLFLRRGGDPLCLSRRLVCTAADGLPCTS